MKKVTFLLTLMLFMASFLMGGGGLLHAQTYKQITTLDELTDGQYVIVGVSSGTNYAMGAFTDNDNFSSQKVEVSQGEIINTDNQLVWTITKDGDYYLISQDNKYVAAATSKNKADFIDNVTDNAKLTASVSDDGKFTLVSLGKTGGSWSLQFNASAKLFSFYSTNQVKLYLFKLADVPDVLVPVAEPKGGTYTETQSVTLTCATEGATIYYTLDGTEPDATKTKYESTPIEISVTTTLKAIAIKDDAKSAVLIEEYAIVEGKEFTQITTVDELVDGEYLIVPENADVAMAGFVEKYFVTEQVFITGTTATAISDACVWNISKGDDGKYLIEKDGKYVSLSSSKTDASYVDDIAETCKFDVTVTDGIFSIVIDATNASSRGLRYNSSADPDRFASYASSYPDVRLFKGGEVEQPAVAAPVASVKGGFYTEAQSVELSATENAVIYYTLDGTEPDATKTQYAAAITIDKTTTLKAIAILDGESSSVLSATYTFPVEVADIAALIANEAGSTYYKVTGALTVLYHGANRIFVTDAAGSRLLIYDKERSIETEYTNGQTLTGVIGQLTDDSQGKVLVPYLPMPEAAEGEAVAPAEKTPEEISEADMYAYVSIKGAVVTAAWSNRQSAIKVGENGTLTLYNQFNLSNELAAGSVYDIVAVVSQYRDALQLLPTELTLVQGVEAEEFDNIAALMEAKPEGKIRLVNAVTVIYQNYKSLYVKDETGYMHIYDNNQFGDIEYRNGMTLTGVEGTYDLTYPESPRLIPLLMPTAAEGTEVEPEAASPADITADDLYRYIRFTNVELAADVTFKEGEAVNAQVVAGDGTFPIRDSFWAVGNQSFSKGDKVDVDGIVYNYDGTVQLYIISIKEHDSSTVGLDAADLTGVTVCSAEDGTLYIVAEAGQSIQIWSVTGQLLYSDVARADLTAVSSMPCGVVIVRVGNETVKAIVR